MKIGMAQIKPIKGDIDQNIKEHLDFVKLAIQEDINVLIFPELSITAYEPDLADALAIDPMDNRLEVFQKYSDKYQIIIGIGAPTRNRRGVCISLILFHPDQERQVYSKKYLHDDEKLFFVAGENDTSLIKGTSFALSICYELSISAHVQNACDCGATVYLSSVAKTQKGIINGYQRLSTIARAYQMTVLMGNCLGFFDGVECVGASAIWNSKGELVKKLDQEMGIVTYDLKGEQASLIQKK